MNTFSKSNSVIAYSVSKSNFSNIYISIEDGEVLVRAPWNYSQEQIQYFVEQKKEWILSKIEEYKNKNYDGVFSYEPKCTNIFGKNYKINLYYKHIKSPNLDLESNVINIALPINYRKTNNTNLLKLILQKMYFEIANNELDFIAEKARKLLNLAPEDIKIQKLENNTVAQCIDNTIIIDPTIMSYDKKIIEFIIFHEFCHLKYKTHSKSFATMLKNNFTNYEYLISITKDIKF